jgi:hypothetical protein
LVVVGRPLGVRTAGGGLCRRLGETAGERPDQVGDLVQLRPDAVPNLRRSGFVDGVIFDSVVLP